jgi:ferredoxin-type protein NapF
MTYKWLKAFRVSIAFVSLLLISLAFLDFTGLFPDKLMKGVLWLQFIPSLLTFASAFSLAGLGFIAVMLITAVFGRFYCSSVCPLGVLQDVVLRFARLFKKIKFRYHKPVKYLRHVLLGLTILSGLMGGMLFVSFLDPYSIFGRIFSDLFRPVAKALNNLLVPLFQAYDNYSIYYVDYYLLNFSVYFVAFAFLAVIIILTVKHGRLYCNTVCPVGTLLGYISRFSFFRIRIDTNNCTLCKKCEQVCKAECISLKNQTVDFSRCISCYNCLTVCKFDAIDFSVQKRLANNLTNKVAPTDAGRRQALKTIVGGLVLAPLASLGKEKELYYTATVPVNRTQYVTPPGSGSVPDLLTKCTACHLCVSACPTNVIQPSSSEFGWEHFMQVRMDYFAGYCTFECTRCTEICPTGALLPLKQDDKKLTQLGKVQFIEDNCIVKTENTDCGSCAEHCPTKAVLMVPYENDLRIPEVDDKICIGCGACEHACPTRPFRAIYVEGNEVHVMAEKPKEKQVEAPDHEDDFPF